MKRATYVLIAIASIVLAIWWWSGRGKANPEFSRASSASIAPIANHAGSPPAVPMRRENGSGESGPAPSGEETSPDIRAQFRASKDYWDFAERIHDAAKHGDGASQYYLGLALNTCDFLYRSYFMEQRQGAPPRIRTLDEAQQLTATHRGSAYSADDVRDIQSRCQRIMSMMPPPFGVASEWMDAALQSGYPLAQANAAMNRVLVARDSRDPEKSRAARSEALALVVDALRSKDAEVVLALASPVAFFAGDEPGAALRQHWTWVMAAYLREPNNASQAEWTKEHCTFDYQCHPDDKIIDIIRRGAGNDFAEIERRARELNEKIDAGTFDETDI